MKKRLAKKVLKIAFFTLLGLVCLVLVGGYAFYYHVTRSPLPQIDGELNVTGLGDSVTILRDSNGVPHIYSATMHDLYFAQGYTMAQDRWWQMEWFRHVCAGRTEELTGKNRDLFVSDIFLRTMGWKEVADQDLRESGEDVKTMVSAFVDGVNAYVMSRTPGQLAMQYAVLGLTGIEVKLEPWTQADTLAFTRLMAYDLVYNNNTERLRSLLYDSLGKEMTDDWLTPPWPFGIKPTILEEEDMPEIVVETTGSATINEDITSEIVAQQTRETASDFHMPFGDNSEIGSNSWVATANMTQSGQPLLANDPHLGIQMPSIWYEIGLHCADDGTGIPFDVVGFTFATTPGVVIGHNGSIAWAVTNAYPDVCDFYQIKVNPDNPLQYEWNGKWRDMTVREEDISFGDGKPPVTIRVRTTHMGPILNDNKVDEATGKVLGFNNEDPVALCWTALDPSLISQALVDLNKAKNWEDFRNALKYWDVPSQNFLYADLQGNIGYQMTGRVPIRTSQHDGLLPAPGWTDEYEWKGFIQFDLLPHTYNPERNYIVAANQAATPPEYDDYLAQQLGDGKTCILSQECSYGYRAQRISQLLEEKAPNTIGTYQSIQDDVKLLSAEEVIPFLADLKFDDTELTQARDWLSEWDCELSVDNPEATLYEEFWAQLVANTFVDEMKANANKSLQQVKPAGGGREMWSVYLLLQEPDNPWWDDVTTTSVVEKRDDILLRSFSQGYGKIVAALGHDWDRWKWGSLHTAEFVSNPLGGSGIGLIERIVNRGAVPVGGGNETVNVSSYRADNFATTWIPSMRMIVDTNDFSNCICINSTGQSGHPSSPYYGNMIDAWRTGKYHPMLWTREQVQNSAVHTLILKPAVGTQ